MTGMKDLTECDVEPGEAENYERDSRQPVREAFKRAEAAHLLAGTSGRNSDPTHDEIGGAQGHNHAQDRDGAEPMQYDLVKGDPFPPRGLNENARPPVRNGDAALDARRVLQ
jgi:hypothetical protein